MTGEAPKRMVVSCQPEAKKSSMLTRGTQNISQIDGVYECGSLDSKPFELKYKTEWSFLNYGGNLYAYTFQEEFPKPAPYYVHHVHYGIGKYDRPLMGEWENGEWDIDSYFYMFPNGREVRIVVRI